MYNNPYYRNYNATLNQQNMFDQIDNQINQLQDMKQQMRNNTTPAINQTFQLAPTNNSIRYANTIDEVSKELVYGDTAFFSKDMSVLWIKNNKNQIRTYELTEIIPKDNKDLQIEYLTARIEELERKIKDEPINTNVIETKVPTSTTTDDETTRKSTENGKPSSVSGVSKSKTK